MHLLHRVVLYTISELDSEIVYNCDTAIVSRFVLRGDAMHCVFTGFITHCVYADCITTFNNGLHRTSSDSWRYDTNCIEMGLYTTAI